MMEIDLSNFYTKTQVDTAMGLKANSADVYTKTQADTLLSAKASTQALTDGLASKAAAGASYTKTESDAKYQVLIPAATVGSAVYASATGGNALQAMSVTAQFRNVMLTNTPSAANLDAYASLLGLVRLTAVPTSSVRAGVLQGAAVADISTEAQTGDINAKINALLAQLRVAGVIAS